MISQINSRNVPKLHIPRIPVRIHTFDAFRLANYRFMWLATVIFSSGFWLQQVVIGWLAYDVTRSPLLTSIILGLDALPILLGGPLGGIVTDHFDKRKLLVFIYCYQAILLTIFAVVIATDQIVTWHLFGFVFMMGVAWTIHDPARMSLITSIVPKEKLVNAFALNSMAFSIMRLVMPALGGLLLSSIGTWPLLILQACLVVSAGMSIQLVNHPAGKTNNTSPLKFRHVFSEIQIGLRFVKTQPTLIGFILLTVTMVIVIVPFVNGLMPVYAAEIFKMGPEGLGLLLSAAGLGSLIGTLILASQRTVSRPGVVAFAAIAILSLLMSLLSFNSSYINALLIVMLFSGTMMTYFSVAGATVQILLPDNLRGRVTGIYMMAWGLIPVGGLIAGYIADTLGAQTATRIGSGLAICLLIASFLLFRDLWHYKANLIKKPLMLKIASQAGHNSKPHNPSYSLPRIITTATTEAGADS